MLSTGHIMDTFKDEDGTDQNDPRIKLSVWRQIKLTSGTFVYRFSDSRFVEADINAENAAYRHGGSTYFINDKKNFSIPELLDAFVSYGTLYYIDNKKFAHPCVCIELVFNTKESCVKFVSSIQADVHLPPQTELNKVKFFTKSGDAYIACLNLIFSFPVAKRHADIFYDKHVVYKHVDLYLSGSSKLRPVVTTSQVENNVEASCSTPASEYPQEEPDDPLLLTTGEHLLEDDASSSSETHPVVVTSPAENNIESGCSIPASELPLEQPGDLLILTTGEHTLKDDSSSSSETCPAFTTNPAENNVEINCSIPSPRLSSEHLSDKPMNTLLKQPDSFTSDSSISPLKKRQSEFFFFSGGGKNNTSRHASYAKCSIF